ncbi:chemotaxis protein CheW, partial [Reinekea forsetii]|nr:chemotaxis protein CheW [Reinekea forsetii]
EPEPEPVPETGPKLAADGYPEWAQGRFECLVFQVEGLKLAVPLLLLGNIHPLDKELTALFDQPDWFIGLLPVAQERNIRVVDTAQLVMPERHKPENKERLRYAVGVHDSDWAFGADSIEGSITLTTDRVKWRSTRTSRPWLAGTVISEMCALVDLDAFDRILNG